MSDEDKQEQSYSVLTRLAKRDKHSPVMLGTLLEVANELSRSVEGHLRQFQQDVVGWQGRIGLAWNAMNVVVRVLMEKGLITEEDMKNAGEALMVEARKNIETTRAAVEEGRRPDAAVIIPTPLDVMNRNIYPKKEA